MPYAISAADVDAARKRIAAHVNLTPTLTSATMDGLAGRALLFKCENLQKVGAFKFRGACSAVSRLSDAEARRGVVTHSSGNHAQALALAARMRGIPAYIVMPSNAPEVKKAAVRGYGGQITECQPTLEARESTANEIVRRTGATFVHPYQHRDVMAGQGTLMLELLEQAEALCKPLDAVIVPVGGGGMLSGCCIAAKARNPRIKIFAAEPAGADDTKRSFEAKQWVAVGKTDTIADGLLTSLGKDTTWPIIRDHVEQVYTVTDAQIVAAMRLVFERMKLVIEPSAAVGVAVALSDAFRARTDVQRVGIVLCGGNVDLERLPWQGAARL